MLKTIAKDNYQTSLESQQPTTSPSLRPFLLVVTSLAHILDEVREIDATEELL